MRRLPLIAALLVALALLAGTVWAFALTPDGYEHMVRHFAGTDNEAVALRTIHLLQTRQYGALERSLDPRISTKDARTGLHQAASFLPATQPSRIDLVSFSWNYGSNGPEWRGEFQLTYPRAWRTVDIAFFRRGSTPVIEAFYVQALTEPMERASAFLAGPNTAAEYLFLVATLADAAFVLFTLFACALAPVLKWRWAWMLFTLVGVTQFTLDWSTGAFAVQPVSFHVPGFGGARTSPFTGWAFIFTIPIGAIAYWCKRKTHAEAPLAVEQT